MREKRLLIPSGTLAAPALHGYYPAFTQHASAYHHVHRFWRVYHQSDLNWFMFYSTSHKFIRFRRQTTDDDLGERFVCFETDDYSEVPTIQMIAFLVVGADSSGSRLAFKILTSNRCKQVPNLMSSVGKSFIPAYTEMKKSPRYWTILNAIDVK